MRLLATVLCVAAAILCPVSAWADPGSPGPTAGAAKAKKAKKAKKKKRAVRRCRKARKVRKVRRVRKVRSARKRRRCPAKAKRKPYKRKSVAGTPPPAAPGRANPLSGPPLGAAAPGPPLGRYLSVSAKEFSLQLSRPALAAGQVTLELRNHGEDPHDLVLSPDNGSHTRIASFGETQPSDVATQSLTLPAGSYYLFCSLPNHESLGMYAHLKVR
jgi:hypothetical protein